MGRREIEVVETYLGALLDELLNGTELHGPLLGSAADGCNQPTSWAKVLILQVPEE